MNYNNLYVTGSYIGRYITASGPTLSTYATLSDWQKARGKDKNSISIDPGYVSSSDLHTTASGLNNKGTGYTLVKDDIDGDSRSSSAPDIGSDEFTPLNRDAGISRLDSPSLFCAGTRNVFVKFGNYGINSLAKVKINWSVNGTAQTAYQWTGTLASGATSSSIKLGSYSWSSNTKYVVKIWTSQPNDSSDQNAKNDTLVTNVYSGLTGSYTVGGTTPDFKSINEAVEALYSRGVCGATTFKIRAGTYPEQISLSQIPGASSSNTVTFISEDNDPSKVSLELASTTATGVNNALIQFNGADYVTFRYLTLKRTGTNQYAQTIEIKGGAHNNRLLDNVIVGTVLSAATYAQNADVIVSLADRDTGNWIKNNVIRNGYRSIDLTTASGFENGLVIEGNTIEGSYNSAIFVTNNAGVIINKNKMSNNGTAGGAYSIYLSGCPGAIQFQNNVIYMTGGGFAAVNFASCQATSSARGSIYNNMISMMATSGYSSPYALYLGTIDYYDVYFNTLHVHGTNTSGAGLGGTISGSATNNFKNNIYSNAGGGPALYLSYSNIVNTSDYNNYDVISGANLAVWNGNSYTTLSGLKTGSSKDANSLATRVLYVSNSELHHITPALNGKGTAISGITTDVDGTTRGTPPDIGADEFDLPKNNAGVTKLSSNAAVCVGSSSVKVVIKNYGTDTLRQVKVNWTTDGITQTAYFWTGKLATDSSAVVTLGSLTFSKNVDLKAWTTSPNSKTDEFVYDDTLITTITAVQLPAADAGKSQGLCIGKSLNIGAPAVLGSTYAWTSNPAGFTSTDPNPSVSPKVATTYTLTETNPTGCKKTNSVTITVNPNPAPEIGIDTMQACEGRTVTLSVKPVTGNSYFWSGPPGFNEVTASIKIVPVIVNGETDIPYIVRETVDATGCYDEDTVVVHINELPIVRAGTDRTICAGAQTTIGSAGTPGHTYSWRSLPVGFTSSSDKPSVSPTVTTTYILTETTKTGCTKTDSVTLTVKPAPEAKVGSPQTICEGDIVTLGAAPVSGNTYSWTSNPSGFSSSKASPTASPKVTTKYYLAEQNSTTGCVKKDSVTITVNPKPKITIAGPTAVCQVKEYIYKSPSINTSNFNWEVTGGTWTSFPTADSIAVTFYNASAEVSLRIASDEGCSDTFILKVSAYVSPKAGFSANTVCLGSKTIFSNSSTGSVTYLWDFGDGVGTSASNSPGYNYAKPGTYKVLLLSRNAGGCTDTISHTVTVLDKPEAGWTATKLSSSTFSFAAKDTTKTAYAWNFGDGKTDTKAKPTHVYASSGTYTVSLRVTDGNNCESTKDSTINVTVGIREADPFSGTLQVYPNPFNQSLTVQYTLPARAEVRIKLTDVTGRVISALPSKTELAGKYQYTWPMGDGLQPGVYVLHITTGNITTTRKLVKVE
jgi:PKD repeat protein